MTDIAPFEGKKLRTMWDKERETWLFSVIDVIVALTVSPNPRKYWSVLKTRLKLEGNQTATNCSRLKSRVFHAPGSGDNRVAVREWQNNATCGYTRGKRTRLGMGGERK